MCHLSMYFLIFQEEIKLCVKAKFKNWNFGTLRQSDHHFLGNRFGSKEIWYLLSICRSVHGIKFEAIDQILFQCSNIRVFFLRKETL